ncbi:MAG: tetratricopeptide repeat protein [Candidatus Tagabacteria bacterium]
MKPETREKLIFLAVCLGLVLLIYGQTIFGDFVFDDRGIVEHQFLLSDLKNFHRILTYPYWTEEVGLYRPVTLISYGLNFAVLGKDPAGFHFVNLILYAISGFLIFLLVKKLFFNKILAYLSSFLFLVLPIHTEVVSNIIGRAEILALFFSLLVFWELSREKINFWRPGLWFLLAMGSKETAIAALPIILFLIYFKEKKFFKKEILARYFSGAIAVFVGGIIYFLARFFVLGRQYFLGVETTIVENPLKFAPFLPRIITAFKVLTIYLKKSFWPFGLCSDYSYNQIPVLDNFFNWETILGAAVFLFLIAGVFIFLKRAPILSFGSALFVFGFLPVSNLLFPTGTIAGERLVYFSSLGLCLWLAAILFFISKIKPQKFFQWLFLFSAISLVVFYAAMSYWRSNDWLTEKRLFISASRCAPDSVLSRSNLGAIYYLEGNLGEAKKELLQAQKIYDGYPKGVNNLGLVYWKEGNKEKARELFLRALSLRFPYYGAYENLALMALEEGNLEEAKKWLLEFYSGNEEMTEFYINSYRFQKR